MRIHRVKPVLYLATQVVNCFQNTNFSEDSQDRIRAEDEIDSCELLSEY